MTKDSPCGKTGAVFFSMDGPALPPAIPIPIPVSVSVFILALVLVLALASARAAILIRVPVTSLLAPFDLPRRRPGLLRRRSGAIVPVLLLLTAHRLLLPGLFPLHAPIVLLLPVLSPLPATPVLLHVAMRDAALFPVISLPATVAIILSPPRGHIRVKSGDAIVVAPAFVVAARAIPAPFPGRHHQPL